MLWNGLELPEPYFHDDDVYIIKGDSAEVMAQVPIESVDCTITSPPYDKLRNYSGYSFDFESIAQNLYRITKQGGVVVWVVGDATSKGSETGTSFKQALYFKKVGFNLHDTMIYEKAGTGASGSNYAYWQVFEYMFVLSKGKPATVNRIADIQNKTLGLVRAGRFREGGNKEKPHGTKEFGIRTNIWRYPVGFMDKSDKTGHPAPFPEKLAYDHIVSWSEKGNIILDPMLGSGTTMKVSTQNNRKCIGIEISEEYCELSAIRYLRSLNV